MTIVVDSSVIVTGLMDASSESRPYLLRDDLFAPHLADTEVLSGLRSLTLGNQISVDEAMAYLDAWAKLSIMLVPTDHLRYRVWALRGNLTPYDATYVALAEHHECRLATRDAKLANAPQLSCEVDVLG